MFLPPIKRLTEEDFKDQSSWIGKLIYPINQVFQSLANGLQKNITFSENIYCQMVTLQFNNNAGELSSDRPQKILYSLSTSPKGLWITNCQDISQSPQPLTGAVFASWQYNSSTNQIYITSISGLVANQKYSISLIII